MMAAGLGHVVAYGMPVTGFMSRHAVLDAVRVFFGELNHDVASARFACYVFDVVAFLYLYFFI